eukprot:CAMPEP_0197405694 /NCGR_PEP_ID=MMETSP1165-20131217/24727_1 /TAXON_ID=284809 /ORGANISM="Chrysocystis fragilis, Strain CCMP3189" /LENGTH=114 /DNA_ID=CAMNT_0042932019 /DNA_START=43 /DNA_END=383 /DNA_ORIENTATION=-
MVGRGRGVDVVLEGAAQGGGVAVVGGGESPLAALVGRGGDGGVEGEDGEVVVGEGRDEVYVGGEEDDEDGGDAVEGVFGAVPEVELAVADGGEVASPGDGAAPEGADPVGAKGA